MYILKLKDASLCAISKVGCWTLKNEFMWKTSSYIKTNTNEDRKIEDKKSK